MKITKEIEKEIEKTILNQKFISIEYRKIISERVINSFRKIVSKEHECSFGFDEKFIGKKKLKRDPKIGERSYSIKKDDWVCSCGKTRRAYLKELREEFECNYCDDGYNLIKGFECFHCGNKKVKYHKKEYKK